MGYNRENYKRIKQEYDGKYLRAQEEAKMRRAEVYASVEGVEQIDRELAGVGLRIMESAMTNQGEDLTRVREQNEALLKKRSKLLQKAGYPKDYTEVRYECEICGDTGAVGTHICSCMKRKLVQAGIESSGMKELIDSQSFDNFSLSYYADRPENMKRMSAIYKILNEYARNYSPEKSGNIVMFGGTGLGKTHLSSAVAAEVINKGHDVFYSGALRMISDFEYNRFGNSGTFESDGNIERYFDCDLLIIDDLGTEMTNQFTTSCLYNVINTRLNKRKQTIISTNLTQDEFRKKYWDRITSRVFGEYLILPFVGSDIRSQKLKK